LSDRRVETKVGLEVVCGNIHLIEIWYNH